MTLNRWKLPGLVLLLLLAGSLVLSGCRSRAPVPALQRFEFKQPHMGTLFTLTLYAPNEVAASVAAEAAFGKIAALESVMTDYDPESELMQLCQKPSGQPVRVSAELFEVLQKAQRIAELSDGAFDVTIGPVVRLWRRTRRTGVLPTEEMLAKARSPVGWQKLKLEARNQTVTLSVPNMQLDLGGIGKGFAADKALEVLKQHGITRELLLRNAAVSTAGDSEQFVEIDGRHYSHIVDPHTGIGLTNRLQVSVVARHATDTDALDTTVRVLGVERGLKLVESQPAMAALLLLQEVDGMKVVESSRWKRIPLAQPAPK